MGPMGLVGRMRPTGPIAFHGRPGRIAAINLPGAEPVFDRHLSRRDLLRTAGAAVAAAALPSFARADDKDPFAGFTVGVQSYTFRNFSLEKAVAKIAECGAKAVEFFNRHVPVDSNPDQ